MPFPELPYGGLPDTPPVKDFRQPPLNQTANTQNQTHNLLLPTHHEAGLAENRPVGAEHTCHSRPLPARTERIRYPRKARLSQRAERSALDNENILGKFDSYP